MRKNEHRSRIVAMAMLSVLACDKPSGQTAPAQPVSSTAQEAPREHTAAANTHAHDQHAEHDHSQHVMPAAAPLAADSIYHSQTQLTDQAGQPFELSSLRGSVVLATMFYASCTSVCPVLIAQLQRVMAALPSDARAHTHVLLVSLDPQRDNTQKLKELAERHNIADPHWHFLRTDSDGVREIAALLGIRYRALPNGDISHSQVIALLDQNGVVTQRMEDAAGDTTQLLAATIQAARAGTPQAAR